MADEEYLAILKQGVEVWNEWRNKNPTVQPDLAKVDLFGFAMPGVNLSHAILQGARLSKTDLSGANLSSANLNQTDLSSANLSRANLSRATMVDTYLIQANLFLAEMSMAVLLEADLRQAILVEVDLTDANVRNSKLINARLMRAKLIETNLELSNLTDANFSDADLTKANLRCCSMVRTILKGTNLTGCKVYGFAAWDLNLEGAKQSSLIITDEGAPEIIVDDIEIAQFVYLLLNHKKFRNVINSIAERGVLLLGRFGSGGLAVLQAVAEKLREMKYLPIIFDFDRPDDRNYTETIKTLVGLSRFVIMDVSGPSVPQELYATVPHFKIPFVPILEKGQKQYAMAVDILEYPWVLKPVVEFESSDQLIQMLPSRIIEPAEIKHQDRQKLLDELFNQK